MRPETASGPTTGQTRTNWPRALLLLLLAALGLRLLLAYVLLPGSGFRTDLGSFSAWAMLLAQHGPGQFYEVATFADYPPGYLYVLWLVGGLAHLLAGLSDIAAGGIAGALIKLPPMLADIGVGLVLFRLVRGRAAARPDATRLGLLAAALYLFNPVTWYDSAIWGQTDAVGALVMLLGVAALLRGNSEGAAALAVLAGLIKPQFGVVFAPLVAVVLLRRHLLAPGSGPQHVPRVPAALRGWFEDERGPWRLLSSAVVGLAVLLLLITPFSLDPIGFVRLMAQTAGGYDWLSVNAYNLWALVGAGGNQPLAFNGGWSPDTVPLLGPIPGVALGAVLLMAGYVVGLGRVAWRDDRRSIVLVAAFLALAFFVLPTRVHERYLFPVFALLPILAVFDRRWLWATVILSIASFINLHGILTHPLYATDNVAGLPLGAFFREPMAIIASALLHTGVFLFVLWHLRPAAAASTAPTSASPAADAVAGADWLDGEERGREGLMRTFRRWTDVVPLRRDRSAELRHERGGVFGRLDVLLLLVVLLSTLGLRTVRLDEPYSMHFDEVYHARTGIEFLQHWQYDMPHSIYEWTHPHLAKYLMAAGIVSLGNNRVTETHQLAGPARAALLERRWSPPEQPHERHGDRFYVLAESELLAYELSNLEASARVELPAGELLALDDDLHQLYIADGAGGLWRIATPEFDLLRDAAQWAGLPAAQPFGQLEGLAGELVELHFTGGLLVAVSDAGEVIGINAQTGAEIGRALIEGAGSVVAAQTDEADSLFVGGARGFVELDSLTMEQIGSWNTPAPVAGMALVTDGVEQPTIYAALGSYLQTLQVPTDGSPSLGQRLPMPNQISDVAWNPATTLIHALGRSQDGEAATIYVAEPRSNAVFADARLPFEPLAVLLDTQPERPAQDRADLLALDAEGRLARVDAGSNAFAWRFPGVLAGALLAVCLYVLARFLFERRSVALIAAALVLLDGMFFSNSRIAMNDSYVALFIVAAMALFAPLYLRRWRSPAAAPLGLLGVGLLLGLALATKWVAAYAIGAVGLLILLRSAVGRFVALAALIGMTGVLGHMAVLPATTAEDPQRNFLFLLLMIGLTLALAVAMVVRPVRLTAEEFRLVVGWPLGLGLLALIGGALWSLSGMTPGDGAVITPFRLILAGGGMLLFAGAALISFWLAGRAGYGPLGWHRPRDPARRRSGPPPPRGWLRPGSGPLGLSWPLALIAVTLVPLIVYVISFQPWIALNNRWLEGLPEGHGGQTFADLQVQMYNYHNYLRATHPASSPWWAWPLNLKPVWFEQEGYANDTTAVIYNTGNLVIFWLAIPAVAWLCHQAWRRRSLALTLLVIAIAGLWLPWARIDRVAFQYHIFTVLPFSFLALAYFLAELWHGPSERTWRLARVAGGLAIVGPALLWLLRLPLCAIGRVETVNPGAEGCGLLDRQVALTDVQLLGLFLLLVALGYLAARFFTRSNPPGWLVSGERLLLPVAAGSVVLGLALVIAGALGAATPVLEVPLRAPELPALLALVLLAVPAWYVLRARDSRRFVVGALVAAAVWFVIWYPNVAGLPLPGGLAQAHLGFLPTWNYSFQFGANQDEAVRAAPDAMGILAIALALALLTASVVALLLVLRAERARERTRRSLSAVSEAG